MVTETPFSWVVARLFPSLAGDGTKVKRRRRGTDEPAIDDHDSTIGPATAAADD